MQPYRVIPEFEGHQNTKQTVCLNTYTMPHYMMMVVDVYGSQRYNQLTTPCRTVTPVASDRSVPLECYKSTRFSNWISVNTSATHRV